ncbi:MAG: protein translocase subunit SecF [Clostridiales bacterium]|jgi:preprotein translocase subunit SecF|nr:protein translocase subunit SecF [Clostridiales bacterium]
MKFHLDFYSKRFVFIGISVALLLAGLVGGLINGGLNFDIQFEGGTHLEVPMRSAEFSTADIESYVSGTFGKSVSALQQQLYTPGAETQAPHLVIKASKSETFSDEEINELVEYLNTEYGIAEGQNISIRTVEPYIGAEMLQKGLLAIFLASVLILLYVWIRFSVMSGLSAALCATLALVHDALIVLAVYAVFRIPINDSFIAAVLTIVGYSINDTIVVYDRIRENSKGSKRLSYADLVNTSLSQTLTRSLNTTITTLICVVTVFVFSIVFNISSLYEFCLPLMIGMIAGVYSTLFIASQCWAMWQIGKQNRQLAAQKTA